MSCCTLLLAVLGVLLIETPALLIATKMPIAALYCSFFLLDRELCRSSSRCM